MKTNHSHVCAVLAMIATLACTMLLSSTALAQNPSDGMRHYFSAGVAVGYAFGEKGGATVGPMINYEAMPADWDSVGMGVTVQAMYRNAEAWTFAFAGRGGFLNVWSAQAELGFAVCAARTPPLNPRRRPDILRA